MVGFPHLAVDLVEARCEKGAPRNKSLVAIILYNFLFSTIFWGMTHNDIFFRKARAISSTNMFQHVPTRWTPSTGRCRSECGTSECFRISIICPSYMSRFLKHVYYTYVYTLLYCVIFLRLQKKINKKGDLPQFVQMNRQGEAGPDPASCG